MTNYGTCNSGMHLLALIWCINSNLQWYKVKFTKIGHFSRDVQLWRFPTDGVLYIRSWGFREVI